MMRLRRTCLVGRHSRAFGILMLSFYAVILHLTVSTFRGMIASSRITKMEIYNEEYTSAGSVSTESDGVGLTFADENETRYVLLVTHQRSGSSILGQLFNQYPQAFYWFEPLDAVYQAMYGTVGGYNVPSDIRSFANGSYRQIPEEEAQLLASTLHDILTCNIRGLPIEVFLHTFNWLFWDQQKIINKFAGCAAKVLKRGRKLCMETLRPHCSMRFGGNWAKHHICHAHLLNNQSLNPDGSYKIRTMYFKKRDLSEAVWPKTFQAYRQCMNYYRELLMTWGCIPKLEEWCKQSKIRTTKVVRLPLGTAVTLQEKIPKLLIVYNVRHPLAISLSRSRKLGGESFMSIYAKKDFIKEVDLICQSMAQDGFIYREAKRQGRPILLFSYEQFSLDPMRALSTLYRYLKLNPPATMRQWLREQTETSHEIASAWQSRVTLSQFKAYQNVCRNFLEEHRDIILWRDVDSSI